MQSSTVGSGRAAVTLDQMKEILRAVAVGIAIPRRKPTNLLHLVGR
jgi:hypothetical protein